MAFTLNRRLAQLIDSNGQLLTGKIPNDYISSDHIADNVITSAMLHTGFTVSASNLGTTLTPTFGNIITTGYIAGPATFTIDPAGVGDNTGTVVIAGNLQVDGTTTTINSTTMTVDDLNLTLASGAANAAAANGAGITVDGASATITYDGTNDEWDFNKAINVITDSVGGFKIETAANAAAGVDLTTFQGSTNSNVRNFNIHSQNFTVSTGTPTGTSTTKALTIDNNQNVGIGTTSPTTALTIRKAIASAAYGQQASMVEFKSYFAGYDTETVKSAIYSGVSDQGVLNTEGGYMAFHVNNNGTMGEKLRIEKSGNVGIGTTAPGVKLDISTSTANTNGVVRIQNNMDNNYEALRLHSLGNYDAQMSFLAQGDSTYWGAFGIDYSDAGKFKLQTDNLFVGGSTLMTWARDGKVGIGTSNPAHQLDISNSGNAVMRLHAGASSSASLRLQNDAQHWDVNLQTNDKFAVYDHTTNTQPFTILPTSGNVGIGTDSPQHILQVFGSQPTLSIRDSTNGGGGTWTLGREIATLNFMTSDTTGMGPHAVAEIKVVTGSDGQASPPGDMTFCTGSYNNAAAEAGRFTHAKSFIVGNTVEPTGSNGGGSGFITDSVGRRNLVLATTSTSLIDVANFRNPNGTVGTIRTNGSSTSYYTSSDYRLKENVVTDWDATTRLKQLKPSRFNFIADADTTLDGFLAHEVQDIVPEATHGTKDELDSDGNPEYQGIDHARLVPLLTKALQEAMTKIEDLTTRIETLEG